MDFKFVNICDGEVIYRFYGYISIIADLNLPRSISTVGPSIFVPSLRFLWRVPPDEGGVLEEAENSLMSLRVV